MPAPRNPSTVVATPPEVGAITTQLARRLPTVMEQIRGLVIRSEEDYEIAGAYLTEFIQPAIKDAEDVFTPLTQQAHRLHKALVDQRKKVVEPWEQAKQVLLDLRTKYRRQVEEEQRRRDAEMRAALQAQAEQNAQAEALEHYEAGDEAAGDAVVESLLAGEVKPAIELPEMQLQKIRTEGTSVRRLASFRVVNAAQIKREYCVPDLAAIRRAVVEHHKGAEAIVGGIEFFWDEREAVRAR